MEFDLIRGIFPDYLEEELLNQKDKVTLYLKSRRTDTKGHSTALAVLLRNLGAWQNSGVREFMPQPLRSALDSQPKQEEFLHKALMRQKA